MAAPKNNQQTMSWITGQTPPANLGGQNVATDVVYNLTVTLTLAQINAGTVILGSSGGGANFPNHKIRVKSFKAVCSGTFTTLTAVVLQTTESSPVNIASLAVAGLTNGARLHEESSSNVTIGAGFLVDNTEGYGLQVVKTGSTGAGGTSITFDIQYIIRSGA